MQKKCSRFFAWNTKSTVQKDTRGSRLDFQHNIVYTRAVTIGGRYVSFGKAAMSTLLTRWYNQCEQKHKPRNAVCWLNAPVLDSRAVCFTASVSTAAWQQCQPAKHRLQQVPPQKFRHVSAYAFVSSLCPIYFTSSVTLHLPSTALVILSHRRVQVKGH